MNRNPKCPVCHRNLIYKDEIETVWVCIRDGIYYEIFEGGKTMTREEITKKKVKE